MKPTNPMAQLQQWKANNTKNLVSDGGVSADVVHPNARNIAPVKSVVKNATLLKFEETSKTKQEAQSEAKHQYRGKLSFNPLAFEYAQLSRQFKLIHDSNRKCLEVYPDDFHHKLKFKEELTDLVERLKAGSKLFNAVLKSHSTLSREDADTFKAFNQANGYLIYKFGEVIAQIDALNVERVENQKLQEAKE